MFARVADGNRGRGMTSHMTDVLEHIQHASMAIKAITTAGAHIPFPWSGKCRCTLDGQLGQGCWPHTAQRVRAARGEPAGVRAASEGGSDCHVSRCLEQGEYQADLERKKRGWRCVSSCLENVTVQYFVCVAKFYVTVLRNH